MLRNPLSIFALLISVSLLGINFYGLGKSMDLGDIASDSLRFGDNDVQLTKAEYMAAIIRQEQETDKEFAIRLADVIAKGTAHIHWETYSPETFHQLVPLWENWILNLMGRFSGIPEFERYHFVTIDKSIERGIGLCGDVSMLMHQILKKNDIDAKIVTFPGHVVVSSVFDGKEVILDPDFGVTVPFSLAEINENYSAAAKLYIANGYEPSDEAFFRQAFKSEYKVWDGPQHFITKKYYLEKISYFTIWILPMLGLIFSSTLLTLSKRDRKNV
jgi:hypothetical protein